MWSVKGPCGRRPSSERRYSMHTSVESGAGIWPGSTEVKLLPPGDHGLGEVAQPWRRYATPGLLATIRWARLEARLLDLAGDADPLVRNLVGMRARVAYDIESGVGVHVVKQAILGDHAAERPHVNWAEAGIRRLLNGGLAIVGLLGRQAVGPTEPNRIHRLVVESADLDRREWVVDRECRQPV